FSLRSKRSVLSSSLAGAGAYSRSSASAGASSDSDAGAWSFLPSGATVVPGATGADSLFSGFLAQETAPIIATAPTTHGTIAQLLQRIARIITSLDTVCTRDVGGPRCVSSCVF